MLGLKPTFHCTLVILLYYGNVKPGLTRLSAASGVTDVVADDSNGIQKKPSGQSTAASVRPAKIKKKGIKSRLLFSKIFWPFARTTAQGQIRQKGSTIEYTLDRFVITVQLFTKAICIDSVKRGDSKASRRSYPISPLLRNIDLKSYFDSLDSIVGWKMIYNCELLEVERISYKDFPFTISIITLPLRLPGFKPDVIRELLFDLESLIETKGDSKYNAFFKNDIYIFVGKVSVNSANGKKTFLVGDIALSKTTVRELKPMLFRLASPDRPNARVLDLIKTYLYFLKSSLILLDRQLANSESVK